MVAPSGVRGVHAPPNAGHSDGFLIPRSTWPLMHASGSDVAIAPTS